MNILAPNSFNSSEEIMMKKERLRDGYDPGPLKYKKI